MSLIERYIFRITAGAFLVCLVSLTAVIWVTQALRELNLVTGKGQTILIFLKVTLFGMPALVMIVAPIALFIAVLYALNRLNGDSELIVMNAAGIPPRTLLRPFLILGVAVSILVGTMTLYAMPESFRALRTLITKIRADVVTRILQEGKFVTLDKGIVFHYRERTVGGAMAGVMVHDSRDPRAAATYLAERGVVHELEGTTYLVLERGSMQRQSTQQNESAVIAFDRYVFDLDQFEAAVGKIIYKPRERSTGELLFSLDREDDYVRSIYGRFRAELHDRLSNPLYPLATLAIAFAALGNARTTRQGRGTAIAAAIAMLILMRVLGFGATSLAVRSAAGAVLMYVIPVVFTLGSVVMFQRALHPKLRRRLMPDISTMLDWLGAKRLRFARARQ